MSDYDDACEEVAEAQLHRKIQYATCSGQGGGCCNRLCYRCYPPDVEDEAPVKDEDDV